MARQWSEVKADAMAGQPRLASAEAEASREEVHRLRQLLNAEMKAVTNRQVASTATATQTQRLWSPESRDGGPRKPSQMLMRGVRYTSSITSPSVTVTLRSAGPNSLGG